MKENRIAGGSSVNPGDENGYADIIMWTDTTVYVWEIKHAGGPAEQRGPSQVRNYVKYLQAQLISRGDKRIVVAGDPIAETRRVQLGDELITVRPSQLGGGVEVYDVSRRQEEVTTSKKNEGTGTAAAVGLGLAGIGLIVATLAEDIATGGTGILDDPATLGTGASMLSKAAYALAA